MLFSSGESNRNKPIKNPRREDLDGDDEQQNVCNK